MYINKSVKIIKDSYGFSLIEVLIAVGLIAVISSIGIPIYREYQNKTATTTIKSEAETMFRSIIACEMEHTSEQCMNPDINTNRSKNEDPDDDDQGPQFANYFTKECREGLTSVPDNKETGKDNCYVHQKTGETGSGCVSTHRKTAGRYVHYCIDFDDGRVTARNSGEDRYCKDTGECEDATNN